jgi:dynactin complex subunit
LNPSKTVLRTDRMEKGWDCELTVGDVFGIPVKNNDDHFYEICRFLIEEVVEDQKKLSAKNARVVDKNNFVKVGDINRKQSRVRNHHSDMGSTKRLTNSENSKRVRLPNPENLLLNEDLAGLNAEIDFLRGANESFRWNSTDDISILRRAQNEVRQARKQLSDWVLQADVPNEIAASIEALVPSHCFEMILVMF